MAFLQVTNRAISKLTSDISATATSFTIATGDGALFPTGNFIVTIENERILVGSRTNDTFSSLTRGYDGTTASSHSAGASVELRIVAKHIQELQNFCNTAGQPNGLATLDANGLVVQNPANATSTPTANAIVMAGSDGKIADGWNVQSIATTASPVFAGLIVDTNTIYVDKTNHRVGIGTTTPAAQFTIYNSSGIAVFRIDNGMSNANGGYSQLQFFASASPSAANKKNFAINNVNGSSGGENSLLIQTRNDDGSPGSPLLSISNSGNIGIGAINVFRATTEGTNVLNIFNGTAPAGTLTNGISIYSSGGNPYVMDSAGNAQPLGVSGAPTFAGLTVDTNTIYVDNVNHRLGIGITSPSEKVVIRDPNIAYDATSGEVRLRFDSGSGGGGIGFAKEAPNQGGLRFYTQYGYTTFLERMRITGVGNILIGGTADRATTAGSAVLNIFNGTPPVGTLTNGISIYSSGGNPYVMDSAGNAQPLGVTGTPKFAGIIYSPSSAPSSPVKGQVYFDSTANKLKVYNGSSWETVSSS